MIKLSPLFFAPEYLLVHFPTFLLSYFSTFSVFYLVSHLFFVSLQMYLVNPTIVRIEYTKKVNYAATEEYRKKVSELAR